MVKAMKVMKAKAVTAMPKGAINDALASKTGLEKKAVAGVIGELVSLATAEVKKTGKFTLPGLCMLKTDQACQESWHNHRIWQDHQSEGSSSHEDCEGILRFCSEAEHLRASIV